MPQSIEETYKKKSHHDHILTMPDTYIGSVEPDQKELWIYNDEIDKMEKKIINYVPGFYKIYDEVIVNARDHSIRDKTCKTIKININQTTGEITVWNDGSGIPIVEHKEHKVYIPEMIFGHLLTSSNYDQKGKTVGGKNGYGAKLANIYSTKFIVETVDSKEKKKYYQEFTDNMKTISKPIIETTKESPYTKISYIPDYERFGMKGMTVDMIGLLKKRAYDLAVCTDLSVSIYLNDEKIKCNSFESYINMYYEKKPNLVYERINSRWRVGVIYDNESGFNHISFVNGIWTYQGGTHINYITTQLAEEVSTHIAKKHKNLKIKPAQIKENITLFIECVVEDPAFSSQTKEFLTSKVSSYGTHKDSKCVLTETFIAKVLATGLVDEVVNYAQYKEKLELNKTDGKKTNSLRGIDKLDDAEWAGTRKSKETRLIITEGDSAKAFAVDGLEVIGRERYGVFPLKGKPLNVRNAPPSQIKNNSEFINLKKILGLKQGENYEDISKLRYGGVIILSDQDDDGTHIRGLLLNMIEHFWPSLLIHHSDFVQTMSTPIIKAFKKTDSKKEHPIVFFNRIKYEEWVEKDLKGDTSKWNIKYYKGLGTSKGKEAKEIFKEFSKRVTSFIWEKEQFLDITESDESEDIIKSKSHQAITLAFDKKRADDRKGWLYKYDRNAYLPYDEPTINISEFINKDLIHFSSADNKRSLPSMCDGLKPSQRKIMYAAFRRGANSGEVKVAQFAAYVSEHTEYHHGEASLQGAIINLAQNYPGSNNINYLMPNGNFGSRRAAGKDSASPRYIFTELSKITSKLFRKEDESILNYLCEEGHYIEPNTYAPILPAILINGCTGIGTGFSTRIFPYNPAEVADNIKKLIKEEDIKHLEPWFRGFTGKVKKLSETKYEISGCYNIIDGTTVHITEIPIYDSIEDYKKFLESRTMVNNDDKVRKIESFFNRSGNNFIKFEIKFRGNELQRLVKSGELDKYLKLSTTISLTNFYLFNSEGVITKYDYLEDIFEDFYQYRLKVYDQRKNFMVELLKNDLNIIEWKVKFIKDYLDRIIIVERKKTSEVIDKLVELKYPKLAKKHTAPANEKTYSYITSMQLFSLTQDRIDELEKEYKEMKMIYEDYLNTPIKDIWLREIEEFIKEYDKFMKDTEKELDSGEHVKGTKKGSTKGTTKVSKKESEKKK